MWAAAEVVIGWLVVLNSALPAAAVLRRRRLRELLMYQLVASMSVGETVAGAVSVVLGTGQALAVPLSAWFCASAVHLRSAVAASTAVCFLCLSLERYITVVHGLRYYDILTEGRQRALLAASWLFAAVYLAFGLAMRWVHGLGPAREMCMYWTAVTLEFRFYGAIFCLLAYIVNLAINVVVGVIGIEQGKRIHRQQTGVNGKFRHSLLQHKGYMAIAILSLMCCIFVFPNILMNLLQSLEIIDRTFVHKITAALRLLSMVTDGCCLALLCPKLRKEYIAIFSCCRRRARGRSSRQASINVISTPKSRLETVAGRVGVRIVPTRHHRAGVVPLSVDAIRDLKWSDPVVTVYKDVEQMSTSPQQREGEELPRMYASPPQQEGSELPMVSKLQPHLKGKELLFLPAPNRQHKRKDLPPLRAPTRQQERGVASPPADPSTVVRPESEPGSTRPRSLESIAWSRHSGSPPAGR